MVSTSSFINLLQVVGCLLVASLPLLSPYTGVGVTPVAADTYTLRVWSNSSQCFLDQLYPAALITATTDECLRVKGSNYFKVSSCVPSSGPVLQYYTDNMCTTATGSPVNTTNTACRSSQTSPMITPGNVITCGLAKDGTFSGSGASAPFVFATSNTCNGSDSSSVSIYLGGSQCQPVKLGGVIYFLGISGCSSDGFTWSVTAYSDPNCLNQLGSTLSGSNGTCVDASFGTTNSAYLSMQQTYSYQSGGQNMIYSCQGVPSANTAAHISAPATLSMVVAFATTLLVGWTTRV